MEPRNRPDRAEVLSRMLPALAVLAAAALGRMTYPRLLERRQRTRRPVGANGVILGADAIDLPRENAPAVLMLHGGGDTPQVLASLARHLHHRGFAVRVPLLPAHGRSLSALASATVSEWDECVREEFAALRARHESVALVGLSLGGALAVRFAAEHHDIRGLVLLAPYLDMPAFVRRMAATSRYWGWFVPYFSSRGAESIRDPGAASMALGHGLLTPAILRAIQEAVDSAAESLPRVRSPALVIQSREDNRISPESAERAFGRLGSPVKKFVWTSGAGHVITVDYGHERVFALTAAWLEAHRAPSSRAASPP